MNILTKHEIRYIFKRGDQRISGKDSRYRVQTRTASEVPVKLSHYGASWNCLFPGNESGEWDLNYR